MYEVQGTLTCPPTPPHPTPPHPTPPHNRDIQKRAFYGNGFRSAGINKNAWGISAFVHCWIQGYLPVLSTLRFDGVIVLFSEVNRFVREPPQCRKAMESHGKPWKKALVTLQRGGLWHRVCQSSVVFFFLFPSRPLALPSSADRALHLLVYGQGRWERVMGYLRYSSASFDQRRHVKLWNHVCRMTPAMLEYCISNDLEWSATGVHHV